MIKRLEIIETVETADRFEIAEIRIGHDSKLSGKTISEIRFRQRHGVTVVGIRRGKDHITVPRPEEPLLAGDGIVVIGTTEVVDRLKKQEPL